MDISNDYTYLSTGGKQGYVNLYNTSDLVNDLNEDNLPFRILLVLNNIGSSVGQSKNFQYYLILIKSFINLY